MHLVYVCCHVIMISPVPTCERSLHVPPYTSTYTGSHVHINLRCGWGTSMHVRTYIRTCVLLSLFLPLQALLSPKHFFPHARRFSLVSTECLCMCTSTTLTRLSPLELWVTWPLKVILLCMLLLVITDTMLCAGLYICVCGGGVLMRLYLLKLWMTIGTWKMMPAKFSS